MPNMAILRITGRIKKKLLFFLAILLLLNSCGLHRLDVQTQYLTPEYLASSHTGTPDPRRYEPLIGQRLLIQWSLSDNEVDNQELFLYLKVRFLNHQEDEVKIPIHSKRGTYIYQIEDNLYCETKGVLTYFAQIQSSEEVLVSWRHPLWVELIQLDCDDSEKNAQ